MRLKDGFVVREIAGEWVAVAVGTRTAEFPGIIALSETAAFVWRLMEKDNTVEHLTSALVEVFDVEYDKAEKDVESFVNNLKEKDLLDNE